MAKLLLSFLFFILPYVLNSQIEGKVSDVNSEPLPFVLVKLLNQSNKILYYGSSNDNGDFKIEVDSLGEFNLEIEHIGYEKYILPVAISDFSKKLNINIALHEKIVDLEGITVISKSLDVVQNQDTLKYNLSNITNGTESNLKEILNKLPNVDVANDGVVRVNGKRVDKLLIDGVDFFGKNQKIATENLPSEMVEEVEYYSKYSDKKSPNKVGDAINISIKDDYKNKITGNIQGLMGYKNRYHINMNLFFFTPKLNFSFVGNSNNINEKAISLLDYYQMVNSFESKELDFLNLNSNTSFDFPSGLEENDRVNKKNDNYLSVNYNFIPNKKIKFKGNNLVNQSFLSRITNNQFSINSLDFSWEDSLQAKSSFFLGQFYNSFIYDFNKNNYIEYNISVLNDKISSSNNYNRLFEYTTRIIDENYIFNNFKINHKLRLKNIIDSVSSFETIFYSNNENFENNTLLFGETKLFEAYYQINQIEDSSLKNEGVLLKFNKTLKNNNFNLIAGYNNNLRRYRVESEFGNSFYKPSLSSISAGIWFYKSNRFLELDLKNNFSNFVSLNKVYFLPTWVVKVKPSSNHIFTFNYEKKIKFPNGREFNELPLVNSYYQLTLGKVDRFKPILMSSLKMNYTFLNLIKGLILNINHSYLTENEIPILNISQENEFSRQKYEYRNDRSRNNTAVYVASTFNKIKIKNKSTFVRSESTGDIYINNEKEPFDLLHHEVETKFSTIYKNKKFNFDFGVNYNESIINNGVSLEPIVQREIGYFFNTESKFNKYIGKLNFTYLSINSNGTKSNLPILGFEIRKLINNKFSLYLKSVDVLNFNSKITQTFFSEGIRKTEELSRLPGYFGLGFKYSLI